MSTMGDYCALEGDLEALQEQYDDCLTQYRSECALYGDAGPAQGLRLEDMRRAIHQLEKALRSHPARLEVLAERERILQEWERRYSERFDDDLPY